MSYNSVMAAQFMGQQLNADLESKRADTEFRKQQTATAQMQSMAMQKEQASKDELSSFIQKTMQNQQEREALPQEAATTYKKLADKAMSMGNFNAAEVMQRFAKTSMTEAETLADRAAASRNQDAQKLAEIADGLQNLPAGTPPSKEQLGAFAEAYTKTGGNPSELPMPNTPAFQNILDSAVTSGMSSKERVTYREKVRAEAARLKAQEEEAAQRHEDKVASRQQVAADKAESRAIRIQSLEVQKQLADSLIEARKTKAEAASMGGAKRQNYVTSTTGYGKELLRNLENVSAFGATDTTGPFAHLENKGTVLSSLSSNAANAFTPGKNQQLESALQGVALEAAQLATNIGGRGVTESLKKEFGKMIEPRKGDTNGTIMYRLANIAEFAKMRMELLGPNEGTPTEQAARAHTIAYLEQIPTPRELTKLFREKKIPNADTHKYGAGTLEDKMKSIADMVKKGDAEATIPQSQRDLLKLH